MHRFCNYTSTFYIHYLCSSFNANSFIDFILLLEKSLSAKSIFVFKPTYQIENVIFTEKWCEFNAKKVFR